MKGLKNRIIGGLVMGLTVSCTSIDNIKNYFKPKPGENEFTLVWIDNKFSNSQSKTEIGLPRIKTIIEGLKQNKNNGKIIFLSIGDIFLNNRYIPFSDDNITKILNEVEVDYLILSENDILFGKKAIEHHKENGNAKILVGNIVSSNEKLAMQYDIRKISGRKVGIFSLNFLNKNEEKYLETHSSDLKVLNQLETAKNIVNEMKDENVEFIIAVVESVKYTDIMNLVKDNPEIDLIISSENGKTGEINNIIGNTQVIKLDSLSENVGVLKVDLDSFDNRKFTTDYLSYNKKNISNHKSKIFEDYKLKKIFLTLEDEEKKSIKKITTLDKDLKVPLKELEYKQTNFSELVFDAIKSKTNSDIICFEIGMLKNDLKKGEVTNKILERTINPQIELVTKEMTGENLYLLIEKGLKGLPKFMSSTLIFSGIDFKINPNNPIGRKVIDLKIGDTNIDLSKTYIVTMPSFFNNLVYNKIDGKIINKDGKLIEIVTEYLKANNLEKNKK